MPEKIRVRCPFCGLTPFLDELAKTAEKPAEIRIFVLKFGGKKPAGTPAEGDMPVKKGRGSAPGYMELLDVTESVPGEVEKMREFFDERVELYQKEKE